MNKHIELVEKWLADNDSVSLDELEANREAAHAAAYHAAHAAYGTHAAYAAHAAHAAAYHAAHAAYAAADTACYVKKYKELTK